MESANQIKRLLIKRLAGDLFARFLGRIRKDYGSEDVADAHAEEGAARVVHQRIFSLQ